MKVKSIIWSLTAATLAAGLAGCPGGSGGGMGDTGTGSSSGNAGSLEGTIDVDGSSTVFPITEAVAEEFSKANPGVRVTVGVSGTGGGMKKLGRGEIAIADASRPIKDAELKAVQEAGNEVIEIPVAYDALAVVVNPKNDWAQDITVEELKKIWEPGSKVDSWNDVRAGWPDRPIKLYGPGTDSGTFDYFTDAVMGEEGASRADYTASEDDNVLVTGVSQDPGGLGYFGVAYLAENEGKIRALSIKEKADSAAVEPNAENVINGSYRPLSRPLFIYVLKKEAERAEVKEFVNYYLTKGPDLVEEVGYVPLQQEVYQLAQQRFQAGTTGTMFPKGPEVGVDLAAKMKGGAVPDGETSGTEDGAAKNAPAGGASGGH